MGNNLMYERQNGFVGMDEQTKNEIYSFCEEYRKVLTKAKTEREFCDISVEILDKAGFVSLDSKDSLKPGDRVYAVNRGKGVAAFVVGEEPIENGVNIIGSHIDSPRLDLKPNPLYEDGKMAYLKTHHYGGIRKYHWFSLPLSLHGVIIKKDGSKVQVNIGENDDDIVFCVSDLLPHLSKNQMNKTVAEAFVSEKMNVIAGNIPADVDKDKLKYAVMTLLNEKYGIVESDFVCAELELVPAYPAKDTGFDRSMIAGYGHDDRVCAYTSLKALIDLEIPKKTAVCLMVDKEEIGSRGNTGMQGRFFENTLARVCAKLNDNYNDLIVRNCLTNSSCLSADVAAAFDSNFADVYEKANSAYVNEGITVMKYTGAGGKTGASDANAEFVAKVCRIFDENDVKWQFAELGKNDAGGGGTISCYFANLDLDVIDAGVALLGMHAPYEIAGKFDIYMSYKGYKAFMNS